MTCLIVRVLSGVGIKLHTSILGTFLVYTLAQSMPIFKKKSSQRFLVETFKLFIVVTLLPVCTRLYVYHYKYEFSNTNKFCSSHLYFSKILPQFRDRPVFKDLANMCKRLQRHLIKIWQMLAKLRSCSSIWKLEWSRIIHLQCTRTQ